MNNDFGQQGINKSCQLTEGGGSGAVNGHYSPLLDELVDDEHAAGAKAVEDDRRGHVGDRRLAADAVRGRH